MSTNKRMSAAAQTNSLSGTLEGPSSTLAEPCDQSHLLLAVLTASNRRHIPTEATEMLAKLKSSVRVSITSAYIVVVNVDTMSQQCSDSSSPAAQPLLPVAAGLIVVAGAVGGADCLKIAVVSFFYLK